MPFIEERAGEVRHVQGDDFLEHFRWQQGEHVSMIGPTGLGKTTLAVRLIDLDKRKHVLFVATKPRDSVIPTLKKRGFAIVRSWPEHIDAEIANKIVLWPKFRKPTKAETKHQQQTIYRAMSSTFAAGGWTIVLDEVSYIVNQLRLRTAVELLWQQGRSQGVTVVAGTQRPANVPLFMYDQATHLFFWRENDRTNLDRIAGIGSADSLTVKTAVRELDAKQREILYVNTRTGGKAIVKFSGMGVD